MKGDFSRRTFNEKKNYSGVLLQQGKLLIDSDWNEQIEILEHRFASFFGDMVGKSGAPSEKAMKLDYVKNKLKLYEGRFYIDGQLIENHADDDENINDLFKKTVNDSSKKDGWYLFYLDVWDREVSVYEDKDLLDTALGVDTSVRIKKEWTVRCERVADSNTDLKTLTGRYEEGKWPDENSAPEWPLPQSTGKMAITQRLSGQSKSEAKDQEIKNGEIHLIQNHLYRVEIHQAPDAKNNMIIKWSRDNGSIIAPINPIAKELIQLTNSDHKSLFEKAKYIELFDTNCSSDNQAGYLVELKSESDKKFDDKGTVIEYAWFGKKEPIQEWMASSTLVARRWDEIKEIPLTEMDNEIKLERDIFVLFSKDKKEDFYRSGDYWQFLVRGGKIVVEQKIVGGQKDDKNITITAKRPDGVKHSFASLALVKADEKGNIVKSDDNQKDPYTVDLRHHFGDIANLSGHARVADKLSVGFGNDNADRPARLSLAANDKGPFVSFFDSKNSEIAKITNKDGNLCIDSNLHISCNIHAEKFITHSGMDLEMKFNQIWDYVSKTKPKSK